jgi:predicted DNA-binding transcriptional regulator YafY
MPANKDFSRRLQILDDCLRRRQRHWTIAALLEEVNRRLEEQFGKSISQRSLYDDIKALNLEYDAPIEKYKHDGETCYRYADPHFSIYKIPVSPEDITTIRDAINLLSQVNGLPIAAELAEVLGRLENTVYTNIEGRHTLIQFEQNGLAHGNQHVHNLFEAIKGKTVLRILYQPFGKEAKEHIVHPYLLKEFRNRWFLLGRIDERDDVTNFALDRIRSFKPILKHPYRENDVFNPDTYFDAVIGVTLPDGAQPEEIILRASAKLWPYLQTKPLHPSQTIIKEYKDGSVRLSLRLVPNYELRMALMSMGPGVVVESPEGLRGEMRGLYERGKDQYNSKR